VKPAPDLKVRDWLSTQRVCYLSSLTIGELQKGIEMLPEGKHKRKLEHWLSDKVLVEFFERTLPVDLEVARVWGKLQASLQGKGLTLPAIDGLLAATGIFHNLTLVTRNEKDFARTGVPVVNPWS